MAMKTIKAKKCKDGWLVEVIETHHIHSEGDVYQLAKQNGLKIIRKICKEEGLGFKRKRTDEVISMYGE